MDWTKSKPHKFKLISPLLSLVVFLFLHQLFTSSSSKTKEDVVFQQKFNANYQIYSLNIPDKLYFCEEKVPIQRYDVMESFDRELLVNTYWQSQTILFIKRSQKWFPIIEPILQEEGVPKDFIYLPLIESGLMNVVSYRGAAGFWQFMTSAAKEFDLEINEEIDERYHLEKATRAACKYLKKAKNSLGSWTLAAASYNMGVSGLKRKLEQQQVDNYYDLLLNSETARYVYRIMAIKEIYENQENFGLIIREKDLYQPIPTKTIEVTSSIDDLVAFAKENNTTYKILKDLNPWLTGDKLHNHSSKIYYLKIPSIPLGG